MYFATAEWAAPADPLQEGRPCPEWMVIDLARWFEHLGQYFPQELERFRPSGEIERLVGSAVRLLADLDAYRAPKAAAALVSLFRSLLEAGGGARTESSGLGGRRGWAYGGEGASDGWAALSVLGSAAGVQTLSSAVARVYVSVDMIEGQDIDRDAFDKVPSP